LKANIRLPVACFSLHRSESCDLEKGDKIIAFNTGVTYRLRGEKMSFVNKISITIRVHSSPQGNRRNYIAIMSRFE
jgi:hypothetical protein